MERKSLYILQGAERGEGKGHSPEGTVFTSRVTQDVNAARLSARLVEEEGIRGRDAEAGETCSMRNVDTFKIKTEAVNLARSLRPQGPWHQIKH